MTTTTTTTTTTRSMLGLLLLIHLLMIRISAAAAAAAATESRRNVFLASQRQARPAAILLALNNYKLHQQQQQQPRANQSRKFGLQINQPQVRRLFSRRLLDNGRGQQPFSSSIHRSYSFIARRMSKNDDNDDDDGFFAPNVLDFESMGVTSPVLLKRLQAMGLQHPTAVQAATFKAIDTTSRSSGSSGSSSSSSGGGEIQDVTIGSETGSGKTLAYLLPLVNDILERKQRQADAAAASNSDENAVGLGYDYARAIILVPNKELVQQLVRMALPLAGGGGLSSLVYGNLGNDATLFKATARDDDDNDNSIPSHERVRMAIFPGGLLEPIDFQPFRQRLFATAGKPAEPVDLIISTPAALGPLGLSPKNIDMFADIPTLVVDEADMLLDGGYLRDLENVLMGFRRADRLVNANSWGPSNDKDDKDSSSSSASSSSSFMGSRTQHIFVAATLPDFGLRSVDAYLQKRFPRAVRVTMAGMHQARHSGLQGQTVWIQEESKKERMQKLAEMLKTPRSSSSSNSGGLLGAKVMVFLNSVDDVEGASQALSRAGINVLPYHAKLSLEERTKTLDRFRKYKSSNENDNKQKKKNDDDDIAVAVLVCTDLAARGLDVPGVDVVVQLQFATNVVSHLHRMGRCGRRVLDVNGSNDNVVGEGRGIVFYGSTEIDLVRVVQEAEAQQERMVLEGVEVDPTEEDMDGEDVDSSTTTAATAAGSVKNAFSRKRGFTKKLKKLKREAVTEGGAGGSPDTEARY